ncbi:NUDIX hydrolase [Lentzea guizhouensis]|uniref:NUDIX hydrolase n=1 Tax=Lentzea guizhouensis TaxID=1586287 RepID=A0A1B2HPU0_9PSEU|nr:NUDIX domain-containing protein [Lentzea guizhouensis]ANZ39725.1 NUDIX hydrolase [Lentzea guizhouensis]
MSIPPYVAKLRHLIGSDHLLWLPGVNGVVVDDEDRVLLHRRADNGRWTLICGILDPGEQPADGIVREVWEETGVLVRVERLTSITVSPMRRYSNGDRAQYLELTFRCSPIDGEAHVHDDESVEVGWFRLHELPELDPDIRARIERSVVGVDEVWFQPPSFEVPQSEGVR